MKSIKYFLGAIFAIALVGCTDDAASEDNGGGTNDTSGTELYFSDELTTSFTVSADDMTFAFIASRTVATTAATYEFDVISDDGGLILFDSTEVFFAEGETEAEIYGELSATAEQGYIYSGAVAFTNTDYAAIYKPTTFEFTVDFPYTWVTLTSDDGSTVGSWVDDIFSTIYALPVPNATCEVTIETALEKEGLYRIPNVYDPEYLAVLLGATAAELEPYVEYGWILYGCTDEDPLYTFVDASEPDAVYFPYQTTGFYVDEGYGYLNFASLSYKVFPSYYTEAESVHGTLENNIISFPKNSIYIDMDEYSGGAWWNMTANAAIYLPGAGALANLTGITFDYDEVNPTAGTAEFDFGVDAVVASIKYAVIAYSDENTDDTYTTVAAAIKAGTQSGIGETTTFTDVTISTGTSGTYTLVALPYDAEGNAGKFNPETCVVSFRMIEGSEVALGLASGVYSVDKVVDVLYEDTYTDLEFTLTRSTHEDYVYYSNDFLGFADSYGITHRWVLSEEDMKVYITPYDCNGYESGFLIGTYYTDSTNTYVNAFAGSGGQLSVAPWEINIELNSTGDAYVMTTFATDAYNNVYLASSADPDTYLLSSYVQESSYIKAGAEVSAVASAVAAAQATAPAFNASPLGLSINTEIQTRAKIGTASEKRLLSNKSL